MPSRQRTIWQDPLAVATIVALLVVGAVVIADLVTDGQIEPTVLALFLSLFGPLTPALIIRTRRNGDR